MVNRSLRRIIPLSLLLVALQACGSEDPGGPDNSGVPEELRFLIGDWQATSLLVTNRADPSQSVDFVAELGAEFLFSLFPDGRYKASITGFAQNSVETGTVDYEEGTLVLVRQTPSSSVERAAITRSGSTVILEGEADFDFNLDGIEEVADSRIVLVPLG